jgi:AraC-like DNA-binding protein
MIEPRTTDVESYSHLHALFMERPMESGEMEGLPARENDCFSNLDYSWRNIRVLHRAHTECEMDAPAMEYDCLVLPLGQGDPQLVISMSIDGYTFDRLLGPGETAIIPSGAPSHWHWISNRPGETLQIQLSPQLVPRISGFKDVRLRKGGMAPHKLRQTITLICELLDQQDDVALAKVAEKVGMSYFHFSRAFKRSMGLSPINYIIRERIERAKKLLAETEAPIAEIALRAGFSSQSHFTTSFRKLAGVTPSSFRRSM